MSYLIPTPGRAHAPTSSTTERQWEASATPAESSLEGAAAAGWVVAIHTTMVAHALAPRTLVRDERVADVVLLADPVLGDDAGRVGLAQVPVGTALLAGRSELATLAMIRLVILAIALASALRLRGPPAATIFSILNFNTQFSILNFHYSMCQSSHTPNTNHATHQGRARAYSSQG